MNMPKAWHQTSPKNQHSYQSSHAHWLPLAYFSCIFLPIILSDYIILLLFFVLILLSLQGDYFYGHFFIPLRGITLLKKFSAECLRLCSWSGGRQLASDTQPNLLHAWDHVVGRRL